MLADIFIQFILNDTAMFNNTTFVNKRERNADYILLCTFCLLNYANTVNPPNLLRLYFTIYFRITGS